MILSMRGINHSPLELAPQAEVTLVSAVFILTVSHSEMSPLPSGFSRRFLDVFSGIKVTPNLIRQQRPAWFELS
jgi:hypothetical protein